MKMTPEEFIEEFNQKRTLAGLGDQNGVTVVLSAPGISSIISFDEITVDPTLLGKGLGRRTLELIVKMSDEAGFELELIPYKLPGRPGMTDEELASWYRRNGFIDSPTRNTPRRLVRSPRAKRDH